MKIEDFIGRFEKVRQSGNGYTARCPSHDDKQNSLKVSPGDDGRILLRCFAGCTVEMVVTAIGLTVSDLMPPKDDWKRPQPETVYRIELSKGEYVEHVRVDQKDDKKKFFWRRNGKNGLGGMRVNDVPLYRPKKQGDDARICITEGEKAADAAARMGLQSYGTVCGASSCPSDDVLRVCQDKEIILWADNDRAGKDHMGRIKSALQGIAKDVITIWTGGHKDDAADYRGSLEEIEQIIQKASGKTATIIIAKKVDSALDLLNQYSRGDNSDRIPFGIKKIDQALRGGFMPGAVYLFGAPSGHGKTTVLQGIGFYCARTRGPALFVSPEMAGEELAEREIIRKSGVPINQRAPWLHPDIRVPAEVAHAEAAVKIKNENLPVYVIEDTDITMSQIGEVAESIKGIRLVIIDYAQEIADRSLNVARYLAVGEVGKDSIALGKKLHVPVIIASQVNVGKTDKGALDYAFRETKDLENRAHASMIMEVKRKETVNQHGFRDVESTRIFARKNRSGPMFDVRVDYKPAVFSVIDYEEKPWAPKPMNEGY